MHEREVISETVLIIVTAVTDLIVVVVTILIFYYFFLPFRLFFAFKYLQIFFIVSILFARYNQYHLSNDIFAYFPYLHVFSTRPYLC